MGFCQVSGVFDVGEDALRREFIDLSVAREDRGLGSDGQLVVLAAVGEVEGQPLGLAIFYAFLMRSTRFTDSVNPHFTSVSRDG